MKEFDIVYFNIRLRVICDEYIEDLIKIHFKNHVNFENSNYEIPTYTLVIAEKIQKKSGQYYKMVDKWFDNATLECNIDNTNRICYATNFLASSKKYKNLLIQYFVANVFNRFLEINGYLGVHSSCVEKNKNGILFVAGRNNGKTTCMLNLMNVGFNSVTNDKIALKDVDDTIIGYGIAQSISIRLSSEFCQQPENKKYVNLARLKGIKIKKENLLEGNNIVLNDTELASLNNVNQVFDTPISCIINPNYDPNVNSPIFELLSKNQILELIKSQYMPLVHETTNFLRNINLKNKINLTIDIPNNLLNIPSYRCLQNERTNKEFCYKIKKLILK